MLIARDAFIIGRISSINAQIGAREGKQKKESGDPMFLCDLWKFKSDLAVCTGVWKTEF